MVVAVAILGRRSPLGNNWEDILPESDIFGDLPLGEGSEKDIYTAFFFEVYDLIMNHYWNELSEDQLSNIVKLAIEKVSEETIETTPLNKNEVRVLLANKMEGKSDDEKKEFVTKTSDIVLANLEPFGRSRLYTSQKQQALSNTVKNIDPTTDHYEVLEVDEEASSKQIADAYTAKLEELKQQEQTPEVQQEINKAERAKEVLGDSGNKDVYDDSGANPTIDNRLITPRIAYIHITKFSPTTV